MTKRDQLPVATVSIARKINLGNYESIDVFLSVGNVTKETTEAEIVEAVATSEIVYEHIRQRIAVKVREIKQRKFGGGDAG